MDDGWLLTPTNACLGTLDPAKISKLDWDGTLVSGEPPSKEAFLHRAMYEVRSGAGAIVHLHSTYSAAVSCMCGLDHANCIPPLTAYYVMKIGRLPLIPYFRPGDPALAGAIRELARTHTAVLLANHGPVVSAVSLSGGRRVCGRRTGGNGQAVPHVARHADAPAKRGPNRRSKSSLQSKLLRCHSLRSYYAEVRCQPDDDV